MRTYNRCGLIPQSWWAGAGNLSNEIADWFTPFAEFQRRIGTMPRITIREQDNDFVVRAMLPGCPGDAVAAEVIGDFLTIKAEQPPRQLESGERCIHCERTAVRFEETIKLPGRVDPAKVTATLKNGILTVTLPRETAPKPSAIKVAIAD